MRPNAKISPSLSEGKKIYKESTAPVDICEDVGRNRRRRVFFLLFFKFPDQRRITLVEREREKKKIKNGSSNRRSEKKSDEERIEREKLLCTAGCGETNEYISISFCCAGPYIYDAYVYIFKVEQPTSFFSRRAFKELIRFQGIPQIQNPLVYIYIPREYINPLYIIYTYM